MSQPQSTPDELRTPDAYPLRVGDRVEDIKQHCESADEPEPAIVIDTLGESVHDVTFESAVGEQSLADYKPNVRFADFTVSQRVVTIAWESWLDANVPGWANYRDDSESLAGYLRTREQSWDIPVTAVGSYDYPESRLRLVDRPREP